MGHLISVELDIRIARRYAEMLTSKRGDLNKIDQALLDALLEAIERDDG